jgi:hypothetical protein
MLKGPACAGPFFASSDGFWRSTPAGTAPDRYDASAQRLGIRHYRVAPTSLGLVERIIRPLEKLLRALACGGHG